MKTRRFLVALFVGSGLAVAVGLSLGAQKAAVAEADLPPGATAEWWADVKESLESGGGVRSIGKATNAFAGCSVATAGDVNGDGYADVVVGAYFYDSNRGWAYVFAGGPGGLAPTPIFTATGEEMDDCLGASVATAGDVNGDGYADVVVGAPGYNSWQGRAYVFAGGAGSLAPTPIFTATGEEADSWFGASVATAGDVNGDGYADVVVGALGYKSFQGRAYVFAGGPGGLAPTPIFSATGEEADYYLGASVATAGDVNGDGYADVVVGAPVYSSSLQGRAYVFAGGPGGLAPAPIFTATGEGMLNEFGRSVATAGDVNGDGYADVVVGAPCYNTNTGGAYVYAGGAGGLAPTPIFTATGEGMNNWFGFSVATAGDTNGDGYADIVVGAPLYDSDQGRAYVYAGGPGGLAPTPILTATGEAMSNYVGFSVATAGDVNGDGYADVVVGGTAYGGALPWAHVYGGEAGSLATTPIFTASGEETSNYFGLSVATAGDVNGDGYADVVVGAPRYNSYQGRAYVYAGGAGGLSAIPIFTATGEGPGDEFGWSVATAGDVNGDGYADVVVGASGYNVAQGRAYVYAGGPGGLAPTSIFSATGEGKGDRFGWSVATAGDVNGDGYADVVVGAYQGDSQRGRAYVYSGGAGGLSATPIFTATGEGPGDEFGWSVATAGDVNGDGYADVVVGASDYNVTQGRAYVYAGGAGGLSATPIFTATGEGTANSFGKCVATAGDVNGDGYSDVVVGAPRYNSYQGRAYVYAGGAGGLSATPIFTATGEAAGDVFGYSVATAGDVNGDGYADVVVGASLCNQGRAYVYGGGAGILSATPIFTATGEGPGDQFGYSVATAGDVNGDGYADVVVGANDYDSQRGRAYVHGGNGGAGRLVLARQGLADGSGRPVQPWGRSPFAFQVQLNATSPLGRGSVRLQVEACPPGLPFGDGSCTVETAPTWTDVTTATSGIPLSLTVTMPADSTLVRWRARVLYDSPLMIQGPWRRFLGQALEADVRVELYRVFLPLVVRSY